jgi:hypothetical protein
MTKSNDEIMQIMQDALFQLQHLVNQGQTQQPDFLVRHESATVLAAESAVEKVLTQHISYPTLGLFQ